MKQLTKQEVMNALIENMSCEPDETGAIEYFLHIKDSGEILASFDKADETFSTYLDPEAYEEKLQENPEYDFREDIEVEDNKYFLEVVEDLTKQANAYLKDWGEDD